MTRPIDALIAALGRAHPGITVVQHRAPDPGGDDGIWYVTHPDGLTDVQVESGTGDAPFLVESEFAPPTAARTVEDAARLVAERLGITRSPL